MVTPVWKDVEQQLAVQLGQHTPLSDRQNSFGLCKAEYTGLLIETRASVPAVIPLGPQHSELQEHQ